MMTNNEIIEQTLLKLDGWILSDDLMEASLNEINTSTENNENESSNIDDTIEILESALEDFKNTDNSFDYGYDYYYESSW